MNDIDRWPGRDVALKFGFGLQKNEINVDLNGIYKRGVVLVDTLFKSF